MVSFDELYLDFFFYSKKIQRVPLWRVKREHRKKTNSKT